MLLCLDSFVNVEKKNLFGYFNNCSLEIVGGWWRELGYKREMKFLIGKRRLYISGCSCEYKFYF